MDLAIQILRFLFRKKWWLIIFPLIAVVTALYFTQDLKKEYTSKTTIYTGVITGYNLESSLSNIDQYATNNMMENFLNILRSYTTLRNVSLKLYAQHMVYGDTLNDTKYIWAEHFKPIYQHAPISVKAIIDKNSFEKTYQNLVDYQKEEYNNYIYGLFMWNYSYYGKSTLESIEVSRVKTSDMIELKYTNDDPNVVYHTLTFLNEEFMKQYAIMRDIESDKAITYFENELARVEKNLKAAEEELKKYSIANKVVNYDEQTKQLTAIENAWQTRYQETIMALNSSTKIVEEMEKKFGTSFNVIKENQDFVNKLKQTSSLSHQIALSSIFTEPESSSNNELQSDLSKAEGDLEQYVENYYQFSGTGEALISKDIAFEWLTAYVQREKAMVELEVLQTTKEDIDQMYKDFSPIGINIKQQNRVISFLEKEYISLMESLNTAKLRKKNTQVSTANLQIITPPQLPLAAEPTKRKSIVLLSGLATFFFIIGFFIFIELVDRTLKNRDRTERLTGGKVFAAMPAKTRIRRKKYYDDYLEAATKQLSNSILNKIVGREKNIVNVVSLKGGVGKSMVVEQIAGQFSRMGRKFRIVNWYDALKKTDREIMYPINYSDILSLGTDKIIIIEHRNLSDDIIQTDILQNAVLNILILNARSSWKDTDSIHYKELVEQIADSKNLLICLVDADKLVVEEFTGQLPPYNFFSNLSHDIYNFGITSGRN